MEVTVEHVSGETGTAAPRELLLKNLAQNVRLYPAVGSESSSSRTGVFSSRVAL
jgi:hypothetical protein